jgi:hypothetical protein
MCGQAELTLDRNIQLNSTSYSLEVTNSITFFLWPIYLFTMSQELLPPPLNADETSSRDQLISHDTSAEPLRSAFDEQQIIIDPWALSGEGHAMSTLPSRASTRRHTRNNSSIDQTPQSRLNRSGTLELLTATTYRTDRSKFALK